MIIATPFSFQFMSHAQVTTRMLHNIVRYKETLIYDTMYHTVNPTHRYMYIYINSAVMLDKCY